MNKQQIIFTITIFLFLGIANTIIAVIENSLFNAWVGGAGITVVFNYIERNLN